ARPAPMPTPRLPKPLADSLQDATSVQSPASAVGTRARRATRPRPRTSFEFILFLSMSCAKRSGVRWRRCGGRCEPGAAEGLVELAAALVELRVHLDEVETKGLDAAREDAQHEQRDLRDDEADEAEDDEEVVASREAAEGGQEREPVEGRRHRALPDRDGAEP